MHISLLALAFHAASVTSMSLLSFHFKHLPYLFSSHPNTTCPPTSNPLPKVPQLPVVKTMPNPLLYLDGKTRVKIKDEWYQCRSPEILKLLQEYQDGYYPDRAANSFTDSKGTAAVMFPGVEAVYRWLREGKQVGVAITKGGHCESNGYADVLPFVERVLLGKDSERNYDDLGGWRGVGGGGGVAVGGESTG